MKCHVGVFCKSVILERSPTLCLKPFHTYRSECYVLNKEKTILFYIFRVERVNSLNISNPLTRC